MSKHENDEYLEQRHNHYLELGYSEDEARASAYADLENAYPNGWKNDDSWKEESDEL